jgi:uncharacterized membrane protein
MLVLGHYRRVLLPVEDQFVAPLQETGDDIRAELFSENQSRLDRALSIILVFAIVAAVATTIFVVVVPKEGEKFTEFFILGAKQKAADYPTRLVTGENGSLFIGIGNHEFRAINYTVETYLLTMEFNETTNTSALRAMDRVNTFTLPVAFNETRIVTYTITPKKTTYNRLELLLFNETVPSVSVSGLDRINASYRDLHLWLTVLPR